MEAHRGARSGIVRHLFHADTRWRPESKEDILPKQVLHRHHDFAVVECEQTDGIKYVLKVSNSVLACMHTSEPSPLYTWKIGGCIQMGVVRSADNQKLPDPFLMHGQPNVPPGCTDPSYRPIPETFEPWAQDSARSESVTGFGFIQEDTALWEPWCWRFVNIQSAGTQTTYEHQDQFGDAGTFSTASGEAISSMQNGQISVHFPTLPPTRQFDPDVTLLSHHDVGGALVFTQEDPFLMMEPWAYAYVHHDMNGSTLMDVHEDQYFEPWSAHFISSEMRTEKADPFHSPSGHSMKPGCQHTLLHRVSTWFKAIFTSMPTGSCSDGLKSCFTPHPINTRPCWKDVLGLHPSYCARFESFFRQFGEKRGRQHEHTQTTDPATAILFETPFYPPPDMPPSNTRVSLIREGHFGPQKHADRQDLIHQATRVDIPTMSIPTSVSHCWTAFQASCTVRLTTVRDVIIPPCLPLFQQLHSTCVDQHEIVSQHTITNLEVLNTLEVHTPEYIRPTPADLGQSRSAPVIWHTGFCHKNDQDRLAPGSLHQTINSGAVPDLTTSDNQDAEYFDSVTPAPHDCSVWSRQSFGYRAPRPFVFFPHGLTDFQSFLSGQLTPDPASESPTEPLRGGHQQLHALRHQNSDVLGAIQTSPEVTDNSCHCPTHQQADLLKVLRSDSDLLSCDSHYESLAYYRSTAPVGSELPVIFAEEEMLVHKSPVSNFINVEQSTRLFFDWARTSARFVCNGAKFMGSSSYFKESYNQICQNRSILVDATQNDLHGGTISTSSAHVWPHSSASILPDHLELYIRCQSDWNESVASADGATSHVQALPHLTISSGAVPSNNRGTMDFFLTSDFIPSFLNPQAVISTSKQIFPPPQRTTKCSGAVPIIYHNEDVRLPCEETVFTDDVILSNNFASPTVHDLIRVLMSLRSAPSEPHNSLQAHFTMESYLQLDAPFDANDYCFSSQLFREECHRPQQSTISSGAVPSDNRRISDRNHFSIRDLDRLQLWLQSSNDSKLVQAMLQCPGTVQPLHHQRSSIGTLEAICSTRLPRPGFADLTDSQIRTLTYDGGHQAHDRTPSRGVYASPYVPRHQNNGVVLPVPPQGLLFQDSTSVSNFFTLQSLVDVPTVIHKRDTVIDESDLRQFNGRSLLFDIRKVTQRQLYETTNSGAVPDPTTMTQGFLRAPTQGPLHATSSSGAVPVNDFPHAASFRGWGKAIYVGGHPAWGRCEIIHMAPNPSFAERCAAATQDNGWLASDEALWFLRLLKTWRSDIAIGPLIQWSPSRDLQHLMAAEDQLQCNNGYLNILLFLVEARWCAVEIDRRTEPVHVVLIQWPQEHHTMVTLEVSRILQIPTNRMLVTIDTTHEVVTMRGWTILFRWYTNFAMRTCLQPLIHATDQAQAQIDSVLHRAQRHWNRTNAPSCLRNFAVECRRAFMSAYARDQPDTRLPNAVSTVMFVGPQEEYVQEVNQVPRPPTHRERAINWLRNMLIQPAWLTNFEVELVLQMTRMQILDRFLPGPLHFDPVTGQLEPFVNDLPSVAGYTKVLFFVTLNYHWISISGTQHQNRWMLTAVVHDPRSRDLPPLFDAIATLLETSPDRVHIQAIPMHSPPHLCGWLLLYSLQEHCQTSLLHDATMLLQRIAVMPNSRIKTLIFEEALSTWTRHAPHQSLVTFATQIRTYFLAHMDTWSSHHVLRFGGMFPQSTPIPKPASWTTISKATKAKILAKIRSHVQRPYICPCVDRLTAFVEVDRMVEANETIASFIAYIKPSPLQWASQFCQENVLPEPCSHDRITEIVLQVPSRSADLIPPHVEAIIYRGRVQFLRSQVVVQVHDLESGIRIFRTGRNHPTTNFDVGELCSGAFSGWTQATKVLSTMGYPIQTKFAVDHDHCVATWYARNDTDSVIAAGWYLLFCEPVDIITASPPCPAFSNASTAAGLEKPEGQVIIDTILKIPRLWFLRKWPVFDRMFIFH